MTTTTPPELWSKRTVLSVIAKFFDPLGFLTPIHVEAKVFMQELWTLGLKWDTPLPPQQLSRWLSISRQHDGYATITIPR